MWGKGGDFHCAQICFIFNILGSSKKLMWTPSYFRYPYYLIRSLRYNIDLVTWLRYTAWIPLYPLGFLCEGVLLLRAIPYFEETERFSIRLPNSWNFGFYFPALLRIYLLCFFFPSEYHHYFMVPRPVSFFIVIKHSAF